MLTLLSEKGCLKGVNGINHSSSGKTGLRGGGDNSASEMPVCSKKKIEKRPLEQQTVKRSDSRNGFPPDF